MPLGAQTHGATNMTAQLGSSMTMPSEKNMEYSSSVFYSDYTPVHLSEQSLPSELSPSTTSPQSCYMYEKDTCSPPPLKAKQKSNMDCWGGFPDDMPSTCTDILYESFTSEESLSNSFYSFCESGKDFLWGSQESDFFDIDVSSPLQNHDDICHGPTLAELNMEDSQPIVDSFYHPDLQKQISSPKVSVCKVASKASSSAVCLKPNLAECTKSVPDIVNTDSAIFFDQCKPATKSTEIKVENKLQENMIDVTVKAESKGNEELRGLLSGENPTKTETDYSSMFVSKWHKMEKSESSPVHHQVADENIDRKWEEIKCYIHTDQQQRQQIKQEQELSVNDRGQGGVRSNNGHDYTSTVFKDNNIYSPNKKLSQEEEEDDDDDDESINSNDDEGLDSDHDDEYSDDSMETEYCEETPFGQSSNKVTAKLQELQVGCHWASKSWLAKPCESFKIGKDTIIFPTPHAGVSLKKVGKSRRSDCDDLTPNPRRLLHIGNELRKLNKIIGDLTPVSELPVNARQRSRKEKNKLASRACRLKKKAQHEANKVKLHGLDNELKKLRQVIAAIRNDIVKCVQLPNEPTEGTLTERLDEFIRNGLDQMVAKHTSEYVNSVLEKTAGGSITGGLAVALK